VTVLRALVIADTHLGPGQAGRLTDVIAGELAAADVIVHAGDVTDPSVLDALGSYAPVVAVLGNNDRGSSLPERETVELAGCRVAVVHDSGPAAGRTARLRLWFPDADAVVFGHSHLPWHQIDVRPHDRHEQHHLNPGSPTQRRRAPERTVAWLELEAGRVASVRHVVVVR